MLDAEPNPPFLESLHLRHAYELIREEGALSQRLMRELAGHPRAFADLKPLGVGRDLSELTNALRRLEGEGLIARRASQRQVPIVHTYELTAMGAEAEGAMQRMRPLEDMPRSIPRRQRSELRGTRVRDPRRMLYSD